MGGGRITHSQGAATQRIPRVHDEGSALLNWDPRGQQRVLAAKPLSRTGGWVSLRDVSPPVGNLGSQMLWHWLGGGPTPCVQKFGKWIGRF